MMMDKRRKKNYRDLYLVADPEWLLDLLAGIFGPYAERDRRSRAAMLMIGTARSVHLDAPYGLMPTVALVHAEIPSGDEGRTSIRLSVEDIAGMFVDWQKAVPSWRAHVGDRMALDAADSALRVGLLRLGVSGWKRRIEFGRRLVKVYQDPQQAGQTAPDEAADPGTVPGGGADAERRSPSEGGALQEASEGSPVKEMQGSESPEEERA